MKVKIDYSKEHNFDKSLKVEINEDKYYDIEVSSSGSLIIRKVDFRGSEALNLKPHSSNKIEIN